VPKPNQILPIFQFGIFPNFTQICPNFTQVCQNFAQICLKKFARGCGRIPCIPSSYGTIYTVYLVVCAILHWNSEKYDISTFATKGILL